MPQVSALPAERYQRNPAVLAGTRTRKHCTLVLKEPEGSYRTPAEPLLLCQRSATHLLTDGYDIRTVQELLGHRDVSTPYVPSSEAYRGMIYAHVLNVGPSAVRSPVDRLLGR
jgi:hypothetical protein